jgi:hypothetical protein
MTQQEFGMIKIVSSTLTSLIAGLVLASNVQANAPRDRSDFAEIFAFHLGQEWVAFDKEQAQREFIHDSAEALILEGEYFFHPYFSYTVGVALLSYDDKASYSQKTTGGYKSSSSRGIPIYGDVGYKQFFGANARTYITLRTGVSVMTVSDRSITDCTDCHAEDIDIDGGIYAMAGAGVRFAKSWTVGLRYKSYFSGDMDNAVGIGFSYGFR